MISRPTEKPVFSSTQKAGVAAALIVSPWFWPVALYPSIVRKTVAIAAAAKTRAEASSNPTSDTPQSADPVNAAAPVDFSFKMLCIVVAIGAVVIGVLAALLKPA
jgi:hypothetical protein